VVVSNLIFLSKREDFAEAGITDDIITDDLVDLDDDKF